MSNLIAHASDLLREMDRDGDGWYGRASSVLQDLLARVAELELRRSETAAMCEQLTVDLESCHTQVSTLQASDRACAEAGADNLSLRLLLADKLATVTAERDAFQVGQLEVAKFLGYGVGAQLSLQSFIMQQLAASQARCREMERDKEQAVYALGQLEEKYLQLQAALAAREAERDDERRKLQDVCMAHGPALMKIHDLERELKRLKLTWTTAQPTVAGGYWVKRMFDGYPTYNVMDVTEHGAIGPYHKPLDECIRWEFAGPIPLPTEAQQASGRSGGAEGHGGQP